MLCYQIIYQVLRNSYMLISQIGRRIFRQRLETGDRDGDMEQRRVGHLFKKLQFPKTTALSYRITTNGTWSFLTSPGISEVDICLNSCIWRIICFPFTLETCFQGYWCPGSGLFITLSLFVEYSDCAVACPACVVLTFLYFDLRFLSFVSFPAPFIYVILDFYIVRPPVSFYSF